MAVSTDDILIRVPPLLLLGTRGGQKRLRDKNKMLRDGRGRLFVFSKIHSLKKQGWIAFHTARLRPLSERGQKVDEKKRGAYK